MTFRQTLPRTTRCGKGSRVSVQSLNLVLGSRGSFFPVRVKEGEVPHFRCKGRTLETPPPSLIIVIVIREPSTTSPGPSGRDCKRIGRYSRGGPTTMVGVVSTSFRRRPSKSLNGSSGGRPLIRS